MKTKIIPFILLALIFVFPFRYSIVDQTSSQLANLLSMVATVVGTLIFLILTLSDGDQKGSAHSAGEKNKEHYQQKRAA